MEYTSLLTPRERDIAALVVLGMSNKQIGRQLGIRHQTVRNQLVNVFRKTSVRKRTQLAVKLFLSPKFRPKFPLSTLCQCAEFQTV